MTTITSQELFSKAYMGHKVIINGKSTTWRKLRDMPEGKRFEIENTSTIGGNIVYNVTPVFPVPAHP